MQRNLWQIKTLEQLKDLLQSFETVQAAIVVGSLANDATQIDDWSDVDLVVVVSEEAIGQFFPEADWLTPITSIYATSWSQDPPRCTLRVCFIDMRRLDLIFVPDFAFDDPDSWNLNPFQAGYHILFSRSTFIDQALSQGISVAPSMSDSEHQFLAMSNPFWFKGTLAVYKVVRNDLLIALHLALDLVSDCLVLRMMLRDRAEGTSHHRIGGEGNEFVTRMNDQSREYSATGILSMIENSGRLFDELAKEWSFDYQARRFPLLDWAMEARNYLASLDSGIRR